MNDDVKFKLTREELESLGKVPMYEIGMDDITYEEAKIIGRLRSENAEKSLSIELQDLLNLRCVPGKFVPAHRIIDGIREFSRKYEQEHLNFEPMIEQGNLQLSNILETCFQFGVQKALHESLNEGRD